MDLKIEIKDKKKVNNRLKKEEDKNTHKMLKSCNKVMKETPIII